MEIIYAVGARFADSGFGYTAYNIVKHIYKKGILKKLITLTTDNSEINHRVVSTMNFLGLIIERCPIQVLKDNLFDLYVSIKLEKCDIFHGWAHQSLLSIRRARRFEAITYIERASAHILTQKRLLEQEYKKFGIKRLPIYSAVINKCLKEYDETDYICVPSSFALESFLENGIDNKKILVIPYGVDLERFKPRQKSDNIFRVLYVGLLSFRKGIQYLLDSWVRLNLKNAELVLAGPILPEFKEFFREYQSFANIKYLGFIKNIETLYPEGSVLVLPSIEEGFGLVVLEAMASGLPAIVTENVGAKDVIEDGRDGFVVRSRDTDLLADKINYLYNNQERIKLMGSLAYLKAKNYTWENTAKTLINHYFKTCTIQA